MRTIDDKTLIQVYLDVLGITHYCIKGVFIQMYIIRLTSVALISSRLNLHNYSYERKKILYNGYGR